MITRPAPNRAELTVLVLTWVGFAAAAAFSPLWAVLLVAATSVAITVCVVFGVIEPRVRWEEAARSQAAVLARAMGNGGNGSLRDVVEKAAESLGFLGVRTQELRRVIDALEDPVLATDAAGVVVLSNSAAERFVGVGPGGTVGRVVDELFPQAGVQTAYAAAAGGRAAHDLVTVHRVEGKRTYQVFAAPVGADGGPTVRRATVMTLRDVTELAAAVRLQTDFVANASHELRTPLSSIRAAAETIETAHDDPRMVDRLVEMIRTNCTRLEQLVSDMLDLSRLQSDDAPVELAGVELEPLFADLSELFASSLEERGLTLEFEKPAGLSEITTEEKSLRLVLRNLIENSAKFAYEGTRITVRVSAGRPGFVVFEVSDRGVGIPIGAQARVFERFFQADAARSGTAPRRGTGLGLAMVKQAVTRLGGMVSVESVWKEGTTMRVELPAGGGGVELR